jgi:hypothetical protein
MDTLLVSDISDSELLARMPLLVRAENLAAAETIVHLMEIETRKLHLAQGCSSLYTFCMEHLGYSEDAALKRVRVTRLAHRLPRVLDELRSGRIHLTGLFLLARHLTEENLAELLAEARGKSRRELERLLASRFPRPDVAQRIEPVWDDRLNTPGTPTGSSTSDESSRSGRPRSFACPEPGARGAKAGAAIPPFRLEPLSASRYRLECTVSAGVFEKLEHAQRLLSHAVPSGDLATVLERALDELIAKETRRRIGTGRPGKRREQRPGSRHVSVEVARIIWERDDGRCAFVDAEGHRCSERRFLTIEHRHPFTRGGPSTPENVCLYCSNHNAYAAEQVFGAEFMLKKRQPRARRGPRSEPPRGTEPAIVRKAARSSDVERTDTVKTLQGDAAAANLDKPAASGGETHCTERVGPTSANRDPVASVYGALRTLEFREDAIARALKALLGREDLRDEQSLLRAALEMLVPDYR